MLLKKLLKEINISSKVKNHLVSKICKDERIVEKNSIFVAIKGTRFDGHDFINNAISKGAKTIFHEKDLSLKKPGINYIKVDNTKKILALLLKKFYGDFNDKLWLIGVTGTNGKSSTVEIVKDYLLYLKRKVLVIGTSGIFVNNELIEKTDNTTPDITKIYDYLLLAIKKNIRFVIMEVSSIGIAELRVKYIDFNVILLTNISSDHLDYHQTLSDYFYTKLTFLMKQKEDDDHYLILNKDDENYDKIVEKLDQNFYTYGIRKAADYKITNVIESDHLSQSFLIDNKYLIKTNLIGYFNMYNILAAYSILKKSNIGLRKFPEYLLSKNDISGRMEKIYHKDKIIIIDYAHTATALKNVVLELKQYNKSFVVVFGCGGNRDKTKRKIMANYACTHADYAIFTTDNPRNEDPMEIINDMTKNLIHENYEVILDRATAIEKAMSLNYDIIAIIGKGNESKMIIGNDEIPFNDHETVLKIINEEAMHA